MTDTLYKHIYVTKNYAQFSRLVANRALDKNHLASLSQKILAHNRLSDNEILVTTAYVVLDGQHRLEVAKNNALSIYYTFADATEDVQAVQEINHNRLGWLSEDYLHSYIEMGKPEYVALQKFREEFPLGLSLTTLTELAMGQNWGMTTLFKKGAFKFRDLETARLQATVLLEIKPHVTIGAWRDRDFIQAFMAMWNKEDVEIKQFLEQLVRSGWGIEAQVAKRDYLLLA